VNALLSTRLETVIAQLGMRKGDFANRIGFTQAYISMIISGKKNSPSARFFDVVFREFHVSVEWLRDGTGEMFSFPELDISSTDASLLAKYRLLPAPERAVVDKVVDAILLKSMTNREKEQG
jgi:transcriptional regulator with XRE-family HTH domain